MPKSACTTIKNLMYTIDTGEELAEPLAIHKDREFLLSAKSEDAEAFLAACRNRRVAFTFVRDPFARAYSAFIEKIVHVSAYSFPKIRQLLGEEYDAQFEGSQDGLTPERHNENFLAFLRYVRDSVSGKTVERPNPHWAPQSDIIDRQRRFVPHDLVGRVENFAAGMNYVLTAAGVERALDLAVRHNEGPPPRFPLRQIMTPELFSLLMEIYWRDVEMFGYGEHVKRHVAS